MEESELIDNIPLIPSSTISVGLPIVDPIYGTSEYIHGPRINLSRNNIYNINLSRNNIYNQRKISVKTPLTEINVYGNAEQLLKIMEELSRYEENRYKKTCQSCNNNDSGYQEISDPIIGDVINRVDSSVLTVARSSQCSEHESSIKCGWSMMPVEGTTRYVLVSNIDGRIKYYAGAGIMLFERLYRSNGREEPVVILFRSTLTGEYEELGGNVEMIDYAGEKTLIRTAKREAKEESLNLFNFDKVNFDTIYGGISRNVDREINKEIYRCYAICLAENQGNDKWKRMYDYNRMKINETSAPSAWKETNDMQRFFISDLMSCISMNNRGSISVKDTGNVTRIISGRTKNCLKLMLEGYMYTGRSILDGALLNARSVVNVKNDVSDVNYPYLVDTFSVIVS